MFLLSSVDFFQNKLIQKNLSRTPIRVSNGLDQDQNKVMSVLILVLTVC